MSRKEPSDGKLSKASAVFEAALVVGRHWNDQEGVNAHYLDLLGKAVEAYDQDSRFTELCRKWQRGEFDRSRFLAEMSELLETTFPVYQCGSCRDTRKWSTGIDCPVCTGAPNLTDWKVGPHDCKVCGAQLTYEESKEHVSECPGPSQRCDECDPSFGCFKYPLLCCKKSPPGKKGLVKDQ